MNNRQRIHPLLFFAHRAKMAGLTAYMTLLCSFPLDARAHGDLHIGIYELTLQIEKEPGAELYLKRGDLYRQDTNYPAALADLERAAELNPSLAAVRLCRGHTQFEARQYRLALPPLNQLLSGCPDHPAARLLRARTCVALGDHASAVKDYDHLVAITPFPPPDCYLERAESLKSLGKEQEAIRSLDEGIARTGNLQTLQQSAICIELRMNRYDAALARVDLILPSLQRREFWQARRGDILEAAGRHGEAQRAWREAMASIAALPDHHRAVKPVAGLAAALSRKLRANPSDTSKTNQPSAPQIRPPP